MAKTSGGQLNRTNNGSSSGNSNPDRYNSVLKHNPGISDEWSAEEQAVLDCGLFKFASDSCINQYAKIAIQLPNKTVRDVALRCKWMSNKDNGKRRKDKVSGNLKHLSHKSHSSGDSTAIARAPFDAGGDGTEELLLQNAAAFAQISRNLCNLFIEENIGLLRQTRDNILRLMLSFNEFPGALLPMPPLPVNLNEELAVTILPPS